MDAERRRRGLRPAARSAFCVSPTMSAPADNPRFANRIAEGEYRGIMRPKKPAPAWPWFAAAFACFALDRVLKLTALSLGEAASPGAVAFTLFRNEGIAFSLPLPAVVFWPAAMVVLAVLLWMFGSSMRADKARAGIVALVLLGAASNLYDRAVHGAIIDYLLFFNRSAINLADGMIVAGLLALYLRHDKKPGTPTAPASAAPVS